MTSAPTIASELDTTTRTTTSEPTTPVSGDCTDGGDHAPIPVQGKNHSVCAKCGATC
jgi:hypothetical protein